MRRFSKRSTAGGWLAVGCVLWLGCQPPISTSRENRVTSSVSSLINEPDQPSEDLVETESNDKPAAQNAATPTETSEPGTQTEPPVRPTARRPAVPGQPLEISFDDLVIGMQQDVVF